MQHMQKWKNGFRWTGTSRTNIWTSFHSFLLAGRQLLPPALFLWQTELEHSVSNSLKLRCFRGQTDRETGRQTDRLVSCLHRRAEGTRVSSCYISNISPIRYFESVKDACLVHCKSKEEPVVTLGTVMSRREACFVCYSSFLSLVVSCLDLRKHCFSSEKWSKDCEGWNLTLPLKKRNEGVQTRSFLLSECWFPKLKLQQHMPMLHSHFSFTYLCVQPLSPHQSFPIHWLPSSSPISSVCAGNDWCCHKNTSHFHFYH